MKTDRIKGAIAGAILGDVIGLRYEGIKPKYINKNNIGKKTFYNTYSDDTEHLFFTLESLSSSFNLKEFNDKFISKLRLWLLSFPFGIGKATLKSIFKSFFIKNSGVVSQGNGAAMRAGAIAIGLGSSDSLEKYVRSNVYLTHSDEEAFVSSLAVAKSVSYLLKEDNIDDGELLSVIEHKNQIWSSKLSDVKYALDRNLTISELSKMWTKDRGAYGYTMVSVPLAIYAFLKNKNNFKQGLDDVIACGGDTDTNAFIYGIIAGSYAGYDKLPEDYLNKISFLDDKINNAVESIENHKEFNSFSYFFQLSRNVFLYPLIFIELFKRSFFWLFRLKL